MSIRLDIKTEQSNLKIDKVDPQMNISGQEATMSIEKTDGDFKIHQKADTIDINSYNAYKQLNSYSPQDLMKKVYNEDKQKTSEAVSQYVRDGEAMMKIENKGKPLTEIGKAHGSPVGKTNLNIEHFPKEPIEVSVKEGYLEVEAIPDKLSTKVQKNLRIEVQPGGVYTTIDKIPKVNIETVGELIDSKV